MNPINILEKKPNCIIYELLPGKPDPNQSYQEGVDNRDRVIQQAQKGPTCLYYAMNYLRRRIGKYSGTKFQNERMIEIIGSTWRKERTALEQSIPKVMDFFESEEGRRKFALIDRETAETIQKNNKPENTTEYDGRPCASTFLAEFLQEKKYKNMQEFLDNKLLKRQIEIDKKLMKHFVSPQKIPKEAECKDYFEARLLFSYNAVNCLASGYLLKKTKWTPIQNIEFLIQELTQNGPLLVSGKLGKGCYVEDAFKTKEIIAGREVYGWQPGSKRIDRFSGHVVVIVGAKKVNENALVYFIDPMEMSDPKKPSLQRYFKISYKNLTTHVTDLLGMSSENPINYGIEIGYGYHGHFKV